MTAIKSGFFQTPTNTPSGLPKKIAVDNPYLTKDEFITMEMAIGLGIDANSALYTSGRLDKILLNASAAVNRKCNRYFDTQTIDETKTGFATRPLNPQLTSVVLANRPYQQINSIFIQVLKWFIQIDTTPSSGYLQDFPDYGYYRIVPLLSTAGTGAGSPMPAEIVDRTPLGVIWTNYTFGYGTVLTAQSLVGAVNGTNKVFQSVLYNRLWAPSQTVNVYDNGVLVTPSLYTIDYANGIVTFDTAPATGHVITADFTTNESVPADIKEAVGLYAGYMIGQGMSNPLGANSYSIQTYSISFGSGKESNALKMRIDELLVAYTNVMPLLLT